MSAPPADTPEPERPIPWWRYRRRLFYLSLVVGPLALLWGGWAWWYRADFPVPTDAQCKALGMDWATHQKWVSEPAYELQMWKLRRETRRLHLPGTIWHDRSACVFVTFGADGLFRVERPPDWEDRLEKKFPTTPGPLSEKGLAELSAFDRTPYELRPISTAGFRSGPPYCLDSPNFFLPDSPWDGYLWAMSRREIYLVFFPKSQSGSYPDFYLRLSPVP